MKWFRFYAEFASDPKVQMMSEANQRRLVMLFCLQCSGELDGLSEEEIAFALRIEIETLHETFHEFRKRGFVDEKGRIKNWDKRQMQSDSSTSRVKKFREKTRIKDDETLHETDCNVSETPQNRTEQNRKEKETTNVVSPGSEKITFDFSTGKFSGLTDAQRGAWREAYPAVDLEADTAKAAAWLIANPKNRKSNYARFLNNWFSRTQDKGGNTHANTRNDSGKDNRASKSERAKSAILEGLGLSGE